MYIIALSRSYATGASDDDKLTRGMTRGSSVDETVISASTDMLNGHEKSATLE